jgi:thioredoxin reductase
MTADQAEFDVVVVGSGAAGMTAALTAAHYLRNAKLQLSAVLVPREEVPGLYLHPDHRRRLRRAPVRSTLDV